MVSAETEIFLNPVWIIFGQTKTCYMIITQVCMASETVVLYRSIIYIILALPCFFSDTEAFDACVHFLNVMCCDGDVNVINCMFSLCNVEQSGKNKSNSGVKTSVL